MAVAYADRGANLVLMARRPDRLDMVRKECLGKPRAGGVIVYPGDVRSAQDLEGALAAGKDEFGKIDTVLANAAFSRLAPLTDVSVEEVRQQFETNVFSILELARLSKLYLESSQGTFAVLNSAAGWTSLANGIPYSMAKFSVRALTMGLRQEWGPSRIRVVDVYPPTTDSEIRKSNASGRVNQVAVDPIPDHLRVRTSWVAERIVHELVNTRREEIFVTSIVHALILTQRYLPGFYLPIARYLIGRHFDAKK